MEEFRVAAQASVKLNVISNIMVKAEIRFE